jgi:hypothetical protein
MEGEEGRMERKKEKKRKKRNSNGIHSPTFGNFLYSATGSLFLPV